MTQEALDSIIEEIDNLTKADIVNKLREFQEIDFPRGTELGNPEMMAYYQGAMNFLLFANKQGQVAVDGRFDQNSAHALYFIQRNVLQFDESLSDGRPGTKTTKAMIQAMTPETFITILEEV